MESVVGHFVPFWLLACPRERGLEVDKVGEVHVAIVIEVTHVTPGRVRLAGTAKAGFAGQEIGQIRIAVAIHIAGPCLRAARVVHAHGRRGGGADVAFVGNAVGVSVGVAFVGNAVAVAIAAGKP